MLAGNLIRELVDTLERAARQASARCGCRAPSELHELVDSCAAAELVTFVIGRKTAAIVDRLQATMAVVEGHAEHVMDAVGAEVDPVARAAARGARASAEVALTGRCGCSSGCSGSS